MSGAALIHNFAEIAVLRRQDNNYQTAKLLYDNDFTAGNVISMTINNVPINPVSFDTSHSITLGKLASEIAENPDIASAVVSGAREITITCALAAVDMMFSDMRVAGGAVQANASITKIGGYIDGVWQPPSSADVDIEISIQPLNGHELLKLPQGDRTREWLKGYTAVDLQTADETTGRRGDFIIYNNKTYEVIKSERWKETDLNHYKVLLAEVNVEYLYGKVSKMQKA